MTKTYKTPVVTWSLPSSPKRRHSPNFYCHRNFISFGNIYANGVIEYYSFVCFLSCNILLVIFMCCMLFWFILFSLLYTIILYGYTMICLFVLPFMELGFSSLGIPWAVLLWTFTHMPFGIYVCVYTWSIILQS